MVQLHFAPGIPNFVWRLDRHSPQTPVKSNLYLLTPVLIGIVFTTSHAFCSSLANSSRTTNQIPLSLRSLKICWENASLRFFLATHKTHFPG